MRTESAFLHFACVRTSRVALTLLLVTPMAPAGDAESAPPGTSTPALAGIAKIKVGYSTQQDLGIHWGEGKPVIGGHPNSGRLWRIKGTPWVLHTDGFEYSKRGLVVDTLEVYEAPEPDKGVPYAHATASDFAWLGEIALGMSTAKVAEVLKRRGLPATQTDRGCETRATGFHGLENNVQLRTWTVKFDFKRGLLSRLAIDASR
jgi:hypothetical protein